MSGGESAKNGGCKALNEETNEVTYFAGKVMRMGTSSSLPAGSTMSGSRFTIQPGRGRNTEELHSCVYVGAKAGGQEQDG